MYRLIISFFQRIWRQDRGASALEFAIVGPIHIALIISIMEMGLIFTKVALLDASMSEVVKTIYTGAAADGTVAISDIEDTICETMGAFAYQCKKNVSVELRRVSTFDFKPDKAMPCRDTAVEIEPAVTFNPGGSSEISYLRACFTTDVITPGLGLALHMDKTEQNRFRLTASTAFMNEPF